MLTQPAQLLDFKTLRRQIPVLPVKEYGSRYALDFSTKAFTQEEIKTRVSDCFKRVFEKFGYEGRGIDLDAFNERCLKQMLGAKFSGDATKFAIDEDHFVFVYKTTSFFTFDALLREFHKSEILKAYKRNDDLDVDTICADYPELREELTPTGIRTLNRTDDFEDIEEFGEPSPRKSDETDSSFLSALRKSPYEFGSGFEDILDDKGSNNLVIEQKKQRLDSRDQRAAAFESSKVETRTRWASMSEAEVNEVLGVGSSKSGISYKSNDADIFNFGSDLDRSESPSTSTRKDEPEDQSGKLGVDGETGNAKVNTPQQSGDDDWTDSFNLDESRSESFLEKTPDMQDETGNIAKPAAAAQEEDQKQGQATDFGGWDFLTEESSSVATKPEIPNATESSFNSRDMSEDLVDKGGPSSEQSEPTNTVDGGDFFDFQQPTASQTPSASQQEQISPPGIEKTPISEPFDFAGGESDQSREPAAENQIPAQSSVSENTTTLVVPASELEEFSMDDEFTLPEKAGQTQQDSGFEFNSEGNSESSIKSDDKRQADALDILSTKDSDEKSSGDSKGGVGASDGWSFD